MSVRTITLPITQATSEQLRAALAEYERCRDVCERTGHLHAWDAPIADLRAELACRR
jgi:hypothetical protein